MVETLKKAITTGLITVEERGMRKLMADDHFVCSSHLCRHPDSIGYYIGKFCLCDVIALKNTGGEENV